MLQNRYKWGVFYLSTKFISVNGYEKIERIKGSKKVRKQLAVKTSEKKTKRMDNGWIC